MMKNCMISKEALAAGPSHALHYSVREAIGMTVMVTGGPPLALIMCLISMAR